MALTTATVNAPLSGPQQVSVTQPSASASTLNPQLELELLKDVDVTTNGKVDNYILVYDSATDNFVLSANPGGGAGSITAGDGLQKTGDVLSVNVDSSTIEINSDTLRVKDGGITNAKLANNSITLNGTAVQLGQSATIEGSDIDTLGNTFSNYNEITSNATTTLEADKNSMLIGTITVTDPAIWTVSGSGSLTII